MDGTEARKIQMHVSAAPFVPREGKTRVMAEQHKDNSSTKARGHSSSQAVRRRSSNGRERSEKPNLNRGGGRGKGKNKPSGEVYDHTQNTGSNSGASRALTPKKNATKRYEPLPFSRERFVQANFSFCIRRYVESPTRGDDRDIFLSWETIETVIVLTDASSSQLNCPICLDKFLAPKMTSCGHVYCYLCMLKFMSYSVDELCRCPLCANSVAITDLKSVEFREIIPCHENQEGTMRLLARPKDSIIPEPFDPLGEDPVGDVPIYNQQQTPFARYLYTNEDHYLDILEKEANDIATALNEAEDRMHMNVFAEMAKASIRSTRSDVKRRARANRAANRKQRTGEGVQRKLSEELVDPEAAGNSSDEKTQNSIKYIYQAASGENIYLHPLNVKCLTYEFQNFREFPLKLNGKICEIERSVVTDEVKRRYNFLSHLPVGCEFGLCELDLSPILQPETLKAFESDFRSRREARQRRHKQAKRENAERRKSAHIYKDFDSLHQSLFSMPLPRELESTDISDLTSFPTLGVSPPNSNPIHDGASEQGSTDGAPVVAEGEPHSPEPTISSYASITRNMGFFPNLQNNGEGQAEADIGESEYPALGGSSSSSAVGQGAWGNKLVPLGSSKSLKKKSMTILSTQQMWPR